MKDSLYRKRQRKSKIFTGVSGLFFLAAAFMGILTLGYLGEKQGWTTFFLGLLFLFIFMELAVCVDKIEAHPSQKEKDASSRREEAKQQRDKLSCEYNTLQNELNQLMK